MATVTTLISPLKPFSICKKPKQIHSFSPKVDIFATKTTKKVSRINLYTTFNDQKCILAVLLGSAASLASLTIFAGPSFAAEFNEPSNALSLPTWVVHVSSVVEWVTAMALVWQYGEKSGNQSWKGLSWGMVPLLGGAFCACTWHFFYNAESLEILVAIQAALTVIGNATMCVAAFRIFKSSQESSKNP